MNEIEKFTKIAKDYVVRERSDFQLQNFVVNQHDTPEMQYRQILIEIKSLITKIRFAELNLQKEEIKLERLEKSDDPIDQIKAEEKRLGITITLDVMEGAKRELAFLLNLANQYPQYTPQDIENNQPEYWEKRLQRQATLDRMSVEQHVSAGNLMSMLNAGMLNRELES
jgi:hypothetical protein